MDLKGIGDASVSNSSTPEIKSTHNNPEDDTEGIFALVNQLDFNIDELEKERFFNDLEVALESEYEKDDTGGRYGGLINFLMKHVANNGKISA